MTRLSLVIALALGSVPITACKSGHDDQPAQTKSVEPPTSVRADLAELRDHLVQKLQTKLVDVDDKLATLKADLAARSTELSTESTAAAADAITKLEDKRAEVALALEQAKNATADRWDQVEKRTNEALTKIDDAYDAAVKKLRE